MHRCGGQVGEKFSEFFGVVEETCQFNDRKVRGINVLQDAKWNSELAFLADITPHLRVLNLQLQEEGVRDETYDSVKASQVKLLLPETHMRECNFSDFLRF